MKMINFEKLLIIAALLCTPLMASNAQAPSATSPRISTSTNVILCMPGLVYKCNQFGCFCVKP